MARRSPPPPQPARPGATPLSALASPRPERSGSGRARPEGRAATQLACLVECRGSRSCLETRPPLRRGRSLDEAARSHARQAAWRCSVSSSLRPLARRPPRRSRGSRLMATRSARCVRMCKQPSPAACAQACRLRPGLLRVPLQGARDMALGAQRMAQRDAQHMGLHTWDTGSGRPRARRYALAMWHGACAARAPRA